MARMIDADVASKRFRGWLEGPHEATVYNSGFDDAIYRVLDVIDHMPTPTPSNEPLTMISIKDELPPDNERVLVYRPCMVDSDIGPYSVQWGWAAKRDGSHWARLPTSAPAGGRGGNMKDRCCDCALWFSYDDGYGFCECDGSTRFCTRKCQFAIQPERDEVLKDGKE